MILKASQRGGGQDLAVHLLRTDDNEHVSVHELRGFISDDLRGAFKEADATRLGTKCSQYLFSLSLNPPAGEHVPVSAFEQAIERAEEHLGLQGQPRAIVFHEKNGRRHAHCVWSRIDADTMTARQMSFFKTKLTALSRELYLEHGWKMPRGLANAAERNPTNFTLTEWQQAKRQGIDPRWLKSMLQHCWKSADSRRAFEGALAEHGFFLARGDKRGLVILDHQGEVYSLPRMLDLKTKEVRARLGTGDDLPGVADRQKTIASTMTPAIKRHIAESRERFHDRSARLGRSKAEMTQLHRYARSKCDERQRREWENETRERAARLPKGLRGLWHRITGKYHQVRTANEAEALRTSERHTQERHALIDKQREQRAILQKEFTELRSQQAEQLLSLRKDIGRFLKFSRSIEPDRGRERDTGLHLKLER